MISKNIRIWTYSRIRKFSRIREYNRIRKYVKRPYFDTFFSENSVFLYTPLKILGGMSKFGIYVIMKSSLQF